ncbi:MAG TPA: hypothetical protein VF701_09410 [Thermoanaerobaculia bacterium]
MINEDLEARIADVEVVSFDIFDTLVLRRHYSPSDVFCHAAGPHSPGFRFLRIAAEKLARLRHRQQQDVSLEQIYALLPHPAEREMAAERQTIFANPQAKVIYDRALALEKRIVAVSDMYLPEPFLRELLEGAGYGEIERIYVSCEARRTKCGGDLFDHVATDLGVAANRILHLGDNEHSDVIRGRERGFQVWHLASPRVRFEASRSVHPSILRHLRRSLEPDHSLLLGILRDGLATEAGQASYFYRWGFSVAGPVVNAFADWLSERFGEGEHQKLFLLARDGFLLQKILAVRHPHIPTEYTFASRRLFLGAALQTLDRTRLDALCTSLPGTVAFEHWTRLGISNPAVEKLLHTRFKREDRIESDSDRRRLEQFFRDAHALILDEIQGEKETLDSYFDSIGLIRDKRPLIVDIGWRASSQRYLEMAVPELIGTSGAYFGLTDDAYRNGHMKAWFFDGFSPFRARRIATDCVEITELIFSAPHPSIRRVRTIGNGQFDAVLEPMTAEEERRISIVREIHAGALHFTEMLHERRNSGFPVRISHRDVSAILSSIVFKPTTDDVRHLGRLPHALGIGSSRYETLIPDELPRSTIALLARHFGRSATRLYWPQGLAQAIRLEQGRGAALIAGAALTAARWTLSGWQRLARLVRR